MVGNCGELCTFTVAYYNNVRMIRFLGNIEAKTDAKGRVFIPATFRKQLQGEGEERLVLRKDVFQDCLVLYPESVWFATQEQLRQRLSKWNARQQAVFRAATCRWQASAATCALSAWTTPSKSGHANGPNSPSWTRRNSATRWKKPWVMIDNKTKG